MKITEDWYSFEIKERWKDILGVRKKGNHVEIFLLSEENTGRSGLLVRLKLLKRKLSSTDEYTELLGRLTGENGEVRYLYANYGKEGAVSEENEDLYWRMRDRLCLIFDSISPAAGHSWST